MADIYISAGSNIEPEKNLTAGLKLLMQQADVLRISTHYRNTPAGGQKQHDYINGIWHIQSKYKPQKIRRILKKIEAACGRVRTEDPYSPRTLDLDLILWDDLILQSRNLTLPDPDIRERAFIFQPLLELEPGIRLPGDKADLAKLVNPARDLYYSPITEILTTVLTQKQGEKV